MIILLICLAIIIIATVISILERDGSIFIVVLLCTIAIGGCVLVVSDLIYSPHIESNKYSIQKIDENTTISITEDNWNLKYDNKVISLNVDDITLHIIEGNEKPYIIHESEKTGLNIVGLTIGYDSYDVYVPSDSIEVLG